MAINKPELLSPAGNWPSLIAAVESGANSVFFGVKGINMRQMANNFELSEIKKIMNYLHKNGKKGYLAVNTIIMNGQLDKIRGVLQEAKNARVDAVILWDLAVFAMAEELGLRIHISTQASVSNIKALEFYANLGAQRIILARECTLDEIKQIAQSIKQKGIPCEIEAFIHGAMCLSISGRCFMSQYSRGQSANQGKCVQPCRREYSIKDKANEVEFVVGNDYVLSPKDLCTIDFIDELIEAGISSFKIEGRMRSPEYSRVVTSVYREAIDAHFEGRLDAALKSGFKQQLSTVFNRGFSSGFYFGEPEKEPSRGGEHTFEKTYLGEVRKYYKKIGVADILVHTGTLKIGEEIIVIGKSSPAHKTAVNEMQRNGKFVEFVNKGEAVGVKLPFEVRPRDKVFYWRKKNSDKIKYSEMLGSI